MNDFIFITGASSGIGKALAIEHAKNKRNLILVARRLHELTSLADHLISHYSVEVKVFQANLLDKSQRIELFQTIETQKLPISDCINNAGFGIQQAFVESDFEKEAQLIELNCSALVHISKWYLHYLNGKKGRIIQIASVASFFPGPFMSVYYASKAFVLSFSRALREELKSTKCQISVVCPGPTLSEFQHVAGMNQSMLFKSALSPVMTSQQVAEITVKQAEKNRFLIVPGFINKLNVLLSPFVPKSLTSKIIRMAHGTH
jgi:short-subunit dehydrogenase